MIKHIKIFKGLMNQLTKTGMEIDDELQVL